MTKPENSLPRPPRVAEKIVGLLLSGDDREAILGDFAEEYCRLALARGRRRAGGWYWLQTARSLPALLYLSINSLRRTHMKRFAFLEQPDRLAFAGLALALPAILLVSGGLLQSLLGYTGMNDALNHDLFIFNPVILMGGLALALALNLLPVLRIQFQDGSLIATLQVRDKWLNLAFITLAGLMGALIFLYLLVENAGLFQAR